VGQTVLLLRQPPRSPAARAAARAQLAAALQELEQRRLEIRHAWLDTRVRLHRAVKLSGSATSQPAIWPTDSVHLFAVTYATSRCLNALTAVAHTVMDSLQ
jgi:hypothetical protein